MTYTHGHHESVLRSHKWRTVDNSAAYLAPHLTSGTSVLDLGCGPGTITADIGRRVAPGRVLGIDASAAVIEEARRDAGGGPNVEFSVGDLYALEMDDHTFDVVHAHQVLQHLPDPVRALREMKRVCKPGGLVAARDGDYGAFRWYPDEPAIDRWLALYRQIARRNAGEPDAGRFLLAWAHAAGFDDVLPGASVWCFATPDDRAWWGGLWADRMTDPRSRAKPSPKASLQRRSYARLPKDGAAGRRTPTPGTLSSTARSSATPSHHRLRRATPGKIPNAIRTTQMNSSNQR
jgi:SAM-dependent methyltransferase